MFNLRKLKSTMPSAKIMPNGKICVLKTPIIVENFHDVGRPKNFHLPNKDLNWIVNNKSTYKEIEIDLQRLDVLNRYFSVASTDHLQELTTLRVDHENYRTNMGMACFGGIAIILFLIIFLAMCMTS